MKTIAHKLVDFRTEVKNEIASLITNIFIKQYGELPNWEEEQEIVVTDDKLPTFRVMVNVGDNYSSDNYIVEKWVINEYRVTLDNNLFFRCGDNNDEFNYDEISTDELVEIYNLIKNYYDNVEENHS